MKKKSRFVKAIKISLISLLVIILAIRLAIPIGGVIIANKILPDILGTDAHIGYISLLLVRGRAAIGKIHIAQPKEFKGAPFLTLKKASIHIDLPSLKKGPIKIQAVTIDSLNINLIRNSNGVFNATSLFASSDTNEVEETASTSSPPSVVIEKLNVRNLAVSYNDYSYDPPISIHLIKGNISLTNLVFDPQNPAPKKLITSLCATAILKQKDSNDAYLGMTSRIGYLGTEIPAVNTLLRLSGFELMSIKPLLVTGIISTLGGSSVDVNLDLAMAEDILDCQVAIATKGNTMRVGIGGTPTNPVVDKSTALGNVITRPGAVVGNLLKDSSGAGLAVVKGAGKTVGTAGKGAARMVGGFGKGAFHTVKGVATLNFKGATKGASEMTIGTVKKAGKTVSKTAGTAMHTVGKAEGKMLGGSRKDDWREGTQERWKKRWEDAVKQIEKMPYPAPKK